MRQEGGPEALYTEGAVRDKLLVLGMTLTVHDGLVCLAQEPDTL